MSGVHAPLAPSGAPIWGHCSGSVSMQRQFPEIEGGEDSLIGEAVHEVSATVIGDFLDTGRLGHHYKRADFLDKPAKNGVLVNEEMLDAVDMYVGDVLQVSQRYDGLSRVLFEYRVQMPMIHPTHCWGTFDNAVIFYNHEIDTLVIGDLKYGWVIVEVEGNLQLICYALGLLYDLNERSCPLPKFVEFRVCQPRPHHPDGKIRTWRIAVADLAPYVDQLRAKAEEALGFSATCTPGLWCTYCTARHACRAFRDMNYANLSVVNAALPSQLPPDALGAHVTLLRNIHELIKAQLTGYETQALNLLQNGTPVPGWEWERTDGRLNWIKPLDEVFIMGDLAGHDLRKPLAKTPLQAISAGVSEALVKKYSDRTMGEPKLKPVNLKKTAAIFGALKK